MLTEPLPIDIFVARMFGDFRVLQATENWRVEPGTIQQIVVSHFRDMGVYTARPGLEKELTESLLYMLRTSPEILSRVRKADLAEQARKQSRHADS